MLVYKAKNQKHVITVFTDITCGYCRKLHSEMKELNDDGITVRYLAFPRQGVPSPMPDNMRSVWCAADPLKAMTDAQNGKSVPVAKCDADIAGQYHLGGVLGVNGTPAIVLENGTLSRVTNLPSPCCICWKPNSSALVQMKKGELVAHLFAILSVLSALQETLFRDP